MDNSISRSIASGRRTLPCSGIVFSRYFIPASSARCSGSASAYFFWAGSAAPSSEFVLAERGCIASWVLAPKLLPFHPRRESRQLESFAEQAVVSMSSLRAMGNLLQNGSCLLDAAEAVQAHPGQGERCVIGHA